MFRRFTNKIIHFQFSAYSADIHPLQNIKIPNKIYRNDLTVLNALASCVDSDAHSSQFGVVNEPWLYPVDYATRKKMLLSKASGKLSARLAFEDIKHEFIRVAQDEPKVKCLLPLLSIEDIRKRSEDKKLTLDKALFLIINLLNPKEAWKFYEENSAFSFSIDVLESLLGLLCATGCEETTLSSTAEELYFTRLRWNEPDNLPKWRPDNEAETLFYRLISAGTVTWRCYESMIRGVGKFQDPVRALELYRDMTVKFPDRHPGLAACHTLLRSLRALKVPTEELQNLVVEVLAGLDRHCIRPNVLTFNSAFHALSNQGHPEFVERLYAEMRSLDIEPVLGTFATVLECRFSKAYLVNLVLEVIEILEDESQRIDRYAVQCVDDLNLLNVCISVLRSTEMWELALRLHSLVLSGRYFHLLATDRSKAHYCDNFIKLITLRCPDIDQIIAKVKVLVPRYYILQPSTIESLVHKFTVAQRFDLLPDLFSVINWNNTVIMELDAFQKIVTTLLSVDYETNDKLKQSMGDQIEKLCEISRIRKESILDKRNNGELVIELTMALNRPKVLWQLIEYSANRNRSFTNPALVLKLMEHYYRQADQWEKIIDLLELFVNCTDGEMKRLSGDDFQDGETDSLTAVEKIFEFGTKRIVPELEKLSVSTVEFEKNLHTLLERFQGEEGSLSSDDHSSDDEEGVDDGTDSE